MELGRRDALAALGAVGVAAGGALTLDQLRESDGQSKTFDEAEVETLVAAAEVLYPSELTGLREFVESYSVGRVVARPDYADGLRSALDELDETAESWYDGPFRELDGETRDSLLREVGCDTADPDPDGTTAERLRYYVVNELLYALYTSPTGGELVGIENPQGHPGGTASYQRGPDS